MSTVVISVYKVANFPDGGGHFWVYMQYAQALRRLGCEVYWLEQLRPLRDPEREPQLLETFLKQMERFGLGGRTLLYRLDRRMGDPGTPEFVGCTRSGAEAMLRRADLMLNFHYAIDPRLLNRARRTALVDIDPGLLQLWMSSGELAVPPHDCYLTTGETVGMSAARFPDCGLRWIYVGRPVCLEDWPAVYDPRCEAFTTAKPTCIELQNAWISDRTLCYLASGKPVVVQHTGPSSYLQHGEGMFRFTSLRDAAEALEEINAHYEHHCRAARDIAETHFDSTRVLTTMLNAALGSGTAGRRATSASVP